MSDLQSPEYRVTTTQSQPTQTGGGSNIVWIILFILALLVIAGLIVWLVLCHRQTENNRQIALAGANVEVTSPTQITATWNQTASTEDIAQLWATLDPPIYNANGTLSNANAFTSGTVTNGGTKATVSKLHPGLKYYTTLTVRNPHTANYAVYNQIVYMEGTQPISTSTNPNPFIINDILQVGQITREGSNNVVFSQNTEVSEDVKLWHLVNGKIADESDIENTAALCLTVDNDVLSVGECDDVKDTWTYNHDGLANRWCLTSTTNNTNPKCMVLQAINPTSKTAQIKVTDQTDAGDAWVNTFPELLQLV